MKAIVKNDLGSSGIRMENVELNPLKSHEVLVKVKYGGICGTDLHIAKDEYPYNPPVIMGHEFSGVVEKLGSECKNFKQGDRVVSLTSTDTCGICSYCRNGQLMLCEERKSIGSHVNGAFAEYIILPEKNLYFIPRNLSLKEAALTEPLACAVRCIIERGKIIAGDKVLISGCGPIALLALQIAKINGGICTLIGTSQDEERFHLAKELGAYETVNIEQEEALKKLNTDKFDVCIECAGAEGSLSNCINLVRKQGNVIQMGLYGENINVDVDLMLTKEINYTNGFATEPSSWEIALRLLEQGVIETEPLITDIFKIDDFNQAFDMAFSKEGIKVLIEPGA